MLLFVYLQVGGPDNLFLNYMSRIHREEVRIFVEIEAKVKTRLTCIVIAFHSGFQI